MNKCACVYELSNDVNERPKKQKINARLIDKADKAQKKQRRFFFAYTIK